MMISSRPLVRAALAPIALVAMLVAAPASAQDPYEDTPGVPDTPGAGRVPALVEAYNSGDASAIGNAVTEHFTGPFAGMPIEQHVAVWQGSLRRTGPLELLAFRTYDPPHAELVSILRSTVTGAYHAFVLPVESGPPHRFTGAQFAPARTPSYLEPGKPLTGDELVAAVDTLVDRLAKHDMFSGTVVIAKDGRTLYRRAAGLASRRFDVPNRLDTKFNLGSMNKMFTAVAVAQLAEQGRLAFDDTVGSHLPDYPNEAVRDQVQVRHLLSHTSGMGSHFTREFMEASKMMYRDIDDYIELFAEDELAFEPGTDWSYSNAGFYVLGKIIEAASGMTYYDYVREYRYGPAGMPDSDSYDMDVPIKNLAVGYTTQDMGLDPDDDARRWLDGAGWRNNYFMHSIKGGPAGGGFSTSPDLIAFARALRSATLLSAESFETVASAKPGIGSPGYGYGFGVEDRPGVGRIVGHSGGFPGINAILDVYLDAGYDVAVMANMDGAADAVGRRIQDLIAGVP
jgi:CubicO group peptidase (beta-lactamase class C family)